MANFKLAREALRIPLEVLPPRRPQWNVMGESFDQVVLRMETVLPDVIAGIWAQAVAAWRSRFAA